MESMDATHVNAMDATHGDSSHSLDSLASLASLSAREKQILSLLARGGSAKRIANFLGLSPRTVEAHSARIVQKLAAENRVHAVAIAVGAGVVSL